MHLVIGCPTNASYHIISYVISFIRCHVFCSILHLRRVECAYFLWRHIWDLSCVVLKQYSCIAVDCSIVAFITDTFWCVSMWENQKHWCKQVQWKKCSCSSDPFVASHLMGLTQMCLADRTMTQFDVYITWQNLFLMHVLRGQNLLNWWCMRPVRSRLTYLVI